MGLGGNANSNPGHKNVESESIVPTADCLRGRLIAERMASKEAKDEADRLENRLIELENLLKEEEKSRDRAEKKLTLLRKKLESLNIQFSSDNSSSPLSPSFEEQANVEEGGEGSGHSQLNSTTDGSSSSVNQEQSPEEDDNRDSNLEADESLALVTMDAARVYRTMDAQVADATVREVLDMLRQAKQALRSSIAALGMDVIAVK